MIILHCMKKETWEIQQKKMAFGEEDLKNYGFVHCSPIEYFWRVAPNFSDIAEVLVLLTIDTDKLQSKVIWEDHDKCGREYPHIYGLINTDSVISILPYNKSASGEWIKNREFESIENK